ncbi:MAG: AAA family ATPase [Bacteroidales bacterium]
MEQYYFKRKIYDQLLKWKSESNGATAILIEGARRVGKSTVAERFARQEYDSYILVDFNKASKATRELFDDLMDLDYIFLVLQQIYRKTLVERKSVIIFDEVQMCPKARQAIKYLVKDGRYDYIETGSLISIRKNTATITIPSEEDAVQMRPLDYEEFQWAIGDTTTIPLLHKFWVKKTPLGAAHRSLQRSLRLYMLVGGMPQAVSEYLSTNNLNKVDTVKRKIIKLYADDFRKIDPSGRSARLFLSIPGLLSRNVSRFQPTAIAGNIGEEKMSELLNNLEESRVVNFVYHSNDPNVGMELTRDETRFKLFVGDTGLFVTLAFWDKDYTDNIIYEKLLSDKLSANLGYVYENLVAQMLAASGNKLFYYTFPADEKHNYEIDFLLSRGSKIFPIEVKSSGYKTHASLDAFCQKYSSRVGGAYLIYTKDLCKDGETMLVPAYMSGLL